MREESTRGLNVIPYLWVPGSDVSVKWMSIRRDDALVDSGQNIENDMVRQLGVDVSQLLEPS